MNRAATKLAALDATFGLTAVTEKDKEFTFADICGGPGGFSGKKKKKNKKFVRTKCDL